MFKENKWFGQSWGAPVCSPHLKVETPVGSLCMSCDKAIESADQGMMITHLDKENSQKPWHLDCFLKTIIPPPLY